MARVRRRWRVVRWVGVGLSVLIIVTWAASLTRLWYCFEDCGKHHVCEAYLTRGRLSLSISEGQKPDQVPAWGSVGLGPKAWWALPVVERPFVCFGAKQPRYWSRSITLPLWVPFLLAAFPTVLLFWRDRRRIPPPYCQNCGYNLTGNVSGTCPECGQPFGGPAGASG